MRAWQVSVVVVAAAAMGGAVVLGAGDEPPGAGATGKEVDGAKPTPQPPPPPPSEKGSKAPWDTEVDAGQQIAAALKKARRNNTRVLLEWGGNTYPKSLAFHEQLTTDEKLRKIILYEYEHVLVDYGQPMGKNVPLSKQFNADVNAEGIPYLTVLDHEGRMFANQPIAVLETSAGGKLSWDAAAVAKFLEANKATPVAAASVLEKGLAAAKKENKRVLVHFGAPWCGWCRRMDAWLMRPEVAALVGKALVEVRIDTERNPGGQAMLDKYAGGKGKSGGIPWWAILDAEGKVVADSFARPGEGNVGFPATDGEIAHFGRVLEKAAPGLSAEDRGKLLETLKETGK